MIVTLEPRPLDWLRPDPRNPRTHPDAQLAKLAESIRTFGFNNPILADPTGVIIAGEARLAAARMVGLETVPVLVLDHLDEVRRRAFALADNRIALDAGWDEDRLAEILAEIETGLAAVGLDLGVTGFDPAEIDDLLGLLTDAPELDAAPPPPETPVSRRGDLWLLGPHRLLCGDSTSAEDVARLTDGGPARTVFVDLVFTDPPYGMSYKGKTHGGILGDDARGEELTGLVGQALRCATEAARPGAAFYVCLTWRTYGEFEAALRASGLAIASCIVWNKGSIGPGQLHYRPQHEFIFYCRGDIWAGGFGESDVWTLARDRSTDYVHPTQKPVELAARVIGNSSRRGDIVLDLFGGSGTTLIACDRLSRRARLMELDPRYVDVIVRRWETLTGLSARLSVDGSTLEDAKRHRHS